jgi:TonB family protein
MRPLRLASLCVIFFCCGFFAFRALAQDAGTQPAAVSYPESADGLKSFLQEIFASMKVGDMQKSSQLLASFALPNHQAWFLQRFGSKEGPRLESKYVELQAKAPDWLKGRLEGAAKRGQTDVAVKLIQKPIDASVRFYKVVADDMVSDFPIYYASGGTDFLGDFVYADGGFRYIDKQVFLALSNSPPMRVSIGGNVLAAKIVKKIQPAYPSDARQDHIEGTVALRVVIGTDGSVQEISPVSGPAALIQPAIDAVKQWRYQPILLNGKPVEVLTQVNIVFSLAP